MGWKYIVIKRTIEELVVEFPLIFPDKLVHADVAMVASYLPPINGNSRIGACLDPKAAKIVAAGMIEHINPIGVGGNSESLNGLSARRTDAQLIKDYSYFHGIVEAQ